MNTNAARTHLLIGLTGGIGSGKSTVAALFAKLGVRIIDTDELSRDLTRSGGVAIAAIRAAFGAAYIDAAGALDRNKMRELVFSKPAEKTRLEA
ncbi:MAG: dephospho-CoA kinase, partial [Gallionellaceae bacterium]